MSLLNGKATFERTEAKPKALDVIPDNIPAVLRELEQWVGWRYFRVRSREEGWKWSKLPVQAMTGRNAKSNDPKTWAPFDEALAYHQAHRSTVDGVGFVFAESDPFAGVDLDDSLDPASGELRSWAAPIVRDLNSYTEISPSGTGVKVFVRGGVPAWCDRHKAQYGKGEVEVYSSGRFFVVTGRRLEVVP
jgi:putative DNA primase/helicase